MPLRFFSLLLGLCLLWNCSSQFDDENVVGQSYARSKTRALSVDTVSALLTTPDSSLLPLENQILFHPFNASGPGRFGCFNGTEILAVTEFEFTDIPSEFYEHYDPLTGPPVDTVPGLDSIILRLPLQLSPGQQATDVSIIVFRAEKKEQATPHSGVFYIDSASIEPLDTLRLTAEYQQTDDAIITRDSSNTALFDHIERSLLETRADTARLLLLFGKKDLTETLYNFQPASPPQIIIQGFVLDSATARLDGQPVHFASSILAPDSALSRLSILKSLTLLPQPHLTDSLPPVVSSIPVQPAAAPGDSTTRKYGLLGARFRIRLDSLFKSLPRDSIFVTAGTAELIIDSAISEFQQQFNLRCDFRFYDGHGNRVTPSPQDLPVNDTILVDVKPRANDTLAVSIRQYLIVTTQTQYSHVQYLELNLQVLDHTEFTGSSAYYSSLGKAFWIRFNQQVCIDFAYLKP